MNAYVDSSVLLRKVLGEPNRVKEFSRATYFVASELLKMECLRTMHRLRLLGGLSDKEMAERSEVLYRAFEYFEFVEISHEVLDRASEAFPTALGTLDALHLASAVLWRRERKNPLTILTHDETLGQSARALGFEVFGV